MKEQNKQFQYLVSVIIPVYNAEKYLPDAVHSLLRQTLSQEQIEILLIDDGSTDGSPVLCDRYATEYGNIRVSHQENAGVSAARNRGIQEAGGKYLAFLDADDWLSKETLKSVTDFFEIHVEETDVVGFTTVFCYPDGKKRLHTRDRLIKKSGIIPCDNGDRINLTRLSVLVKNRMQENERFKTGLRFHEDEDYLLHVLADKACFGYVKEACYNYRQETGGATDTAADPEKVFEPSMNLYDSWLKTYRERPELDHYVQNMILNDFSWKLKKDKLLPKHLSGTPYLEAEKRIEEIVALMEPDRILNHPGFTPEDRFFLYAIRAANLKSNESIGPSRLPVRLEFLTVQDDMLTVEGLLPACGDEMRQGGHRDLQLVVNEDRYPCVCSIRDEETLTIAGKTIARGIGFKAIIPLTGYNKQAKIRIQQNYGGVLRDRTFLEYGKHFPVSDYRHSYYISDGWIVRQNGNGLTVEKARPGCRGLYELSYLCQLWKQNDVGTRKAVAVRCLYHVLKLFCRKPIWLFSDCRKRAGDNGEAMFRFMAEQHPNEVKTVFLLDQDSPDAKRVSQWGKTVSLYSVRHKLAHLLCRVNAVSREDGPTIEPFEVHDKAYRDILADVSTVFLQHGVTTGDRSDLLKRSKTGLRGITASSEREAEAIRSGPYGYAKEIWLTGSPRYDDLPIGDAGGKQITIMPAQKDSITGKADLLKAYEELLNSERLIEAARRHGFTIAFCPEPGFRKDKDPLRHHPDVTILDSATSNAQICKESSLLVTDYSSLAFDFAYMEKPVIYSQYDRKGFAGIQHTEAKACFDYEKEGFGEVEYNPGATIERIVEYMERDCRIKDRYHQRACSFFKYHDHRNCQRVYEKLRELSK